MEQDPNLFAQGQAGQRTMENVLAPTETDTPAQTADKRRALQRWYEARRQAARQRYLRWLNRRSLERHVGSADVNKMGQYVVHHSIEQAQPQNRRRLLLTRRWQEFMRRNFRRRSSEYNTQYQPGRPKPPLQ